MLRNTVSTSLFMLAMLFMVSPLIENASASPVRYVGTEQHPGKGSEDFWAEKKGQAFVDDAFKATKSKGFLAKLFR